MSRPTEGELCKELHSLVRWEEFALSLPEIKQPPDIDIIKRDNPNDTQAQKRSLFSLWLRKSPIASWQDVIDALETAKEFALAKQLKVSKVCMYHSCYYYIRDVFVGKPDWSFCKV